MDIENEKGVRNHNGQAMTHGETKKFLSDIKLERNAQCLVPL